LDSKSIFDQVHVFHFQTSVQNMLTSRSTPDVKMLAFPNQMHDRCPVVLFGSPSTPSGPSQRRRAILFSFNAGTAEPFRVSPPEAVVYSKASHHFAGMVTCERNFALYRAWVA
jgi:hypothetical protein